MSSPPLVSMVILHQNHKLLMQLRDDFDHILFPGQWGLFGGHLEDGESPKLGLVREVSEEISYLLEQPTLFRTYKDEKAHRYIYFAALDKSINDLELNEGQDLDLVPIQSICAGKHYSCKLKQMRKLGSIHRQILLDFIDFATQNLVELDFNRQFK